MNVVTDNTCAYGLARTNEGCVRSLASLAPNSFERIQILSIALGFVALAVASYKYMRSVHNQGAKLQQRAFFICMYAAVTFIVRGVDPMSYGHFIPRPIGHFIVDSCTAAIFTIFIMTLDFWISIIHKGRPSCARTAGRSKWFKYSAIAFVWVEKVVVNVSLVWSKGFDSSFALFDLVATVVTAAVLCIFFAIYGLRVIRRLQHIDRMQARRLSIEMYYDSAQTSRIDLAASHATMLSENDLEAQQQDSVVPPPPVIKQFSLPRPAALRKRKPARKIKEMLLVTEVVALICIVGQIYTGIHRHANYKELACANGFHCDTISATWPLSHAFQYVTIWCVIFTFRKTKRDRKAANQLGLIQPAVLA